MLTKEQMALAILDLVANFVRNDVEVEFGRDGTKMCLRFGGDIKGAPLIKERHDRPSVLDLPLFSTNGAVSEGASYSAVESLYRAILEVTPKQVKRSIVEANRD